MCALMKVISHDRRLFGTAPVVEQWHTCRRATNVSLEPSSCRNHQEAVTRSLKAFTTTDNRRCSPPSAHHARAVYGDRCKHQQKGSKLHHWIARRGQRGVHSDSARPRCELRWWREHFSKYCSSFGASRRFRIRWPLRRARIRGTGLRLLYDDRRVEAAARVRGASLGLHPRIPVAIGHCVLIRRSALDLVGAFDLAFSPGYGEEVDFSLRCAERGLVHVVADDVLVLHHGGASFGGGGKRTQGQHDHDVLVNNRYPYFPAWVGWVSNDLRNPLGRAIAAARSALVPLSVTIA